MRFVFEIIDTFEDLVKELKTVMFNLDFKNNFKSFIAEDVELSTVPTAIDNQMFPEVPSSYIVLSTKEGSSARIVEKPNDRGTGGEDYRWTTKTVYLVASNDTATVKVMFIKDGTEDIPDGQQKQLKE